MKSLCRFSLIIILSLPFRFHLIGQENNEPYVLKFNRVDFFVPSYSHSISKSETLKNISYITIDFNLKKITILTFFSDGPSESIYTFQNTIDKGNFYRIICQASNYAEVIIDIENSAKWISRTITHNGIYHKYYNYGEY